MSSSIVEAVATIKQTVAQCLTVEFIEAACRAEDHQWRQRQLGPAQTIHAFITQILHGNTACSHTVRLARLSCSAEAYCQARARLPLSVFERLLQETSRRARRSTAVPLWRGHRTFLVDGSSFSMPDTDDLRDHFGQPGAQLPGCGFPLAHWLTMFDAAQGLLVKQLAAPMRTHDMSQVAQLHSELQPGDVLVGDKAFASYIHLALLLRKKLHGVFRVHQRQLVSFRQDRKLVGQQPKGTTATTATSQLVRKLGKFDQLVKYRRPAQRPAWLSPEEYAQLPEEIIVREIRYRVPANQSRTREVTLVTTLLDPVLYPAEALAALYGVRWQIETNLGHLKTTMGMDVLRCETVAGVKKELAMYALVYNLVCLSMMKASYEQQTPVERISFVDALRWLATNCQTRTPLRLRVHPARPHRLEPRVRKRRPKTYALMKQPRCQLRERLLTKKVTS